MKNQEIKKDHEWYKNGIAYLESLQELNNIEPKTIFYATEDKEVNNIKELYATVNSSRVAYYKFLKNRDTVNKMLLSYIKKMQKYTCFAIGYQCSQLKLITRVSEDRYPTLKQ